MGRINKMLLLLLLSSLAGCGPADMHESILERSTGIVIERNLNVTNGALGTGKSCQLLLMLKDGRRISIDGHWVDGAAPYDLCKLMLKGETVRLVRYQYSGWYLENAKN